MWKPRLPDVSSGESAKAAVDAADQVWMALALRRLQCANSIGRVSLEELLELRPGAAEAPACEVQAIRQCELRQRVGAAHRSLKSPRIAPWPSSSLPHPACPITAPR